MYSGEDTILTFKCRLKHRLNIIFKRKGILEEINEVGALFNTSALIYTCLERMYSFVFKIGRVV